MTLSDRAAKYFGMHTEPRTSVLLGDGKVLVVGTRAGRKVLATYREAPNGAARGEYTLLTEKQRTALVSALTNGEA